MSNIKKCGIFYTDNTHPNVTKVVLENIKKIKKEYVDIITCSNEKIQNNPFKNLINYNPERSHKNIVEKILMCLYELKNNNYQYVSFLEHDVFYSDTYFDYPEFNNCICNMNYLGLCKDGYQEKLPAQLPLHQMTMDFNFAINHFEKEMEIINEKGWDCLEPAEVDRYENINPSLHINHGSHFTSHYQCYATANKIYDNYWGDYKILWNKIIL